MTRNLSFLVATVLASAVLAEEQHPRMFITPERLAVIRQQAAIEGSHHQRALAALRAGGDAEEEDAEGGKYGKGYRAVEAAFLSAVVEDAAEKRKHADNAYKTIVAWTNTGSKTLGKSMEARCLALAYDWAYPAWTDAQRQAVRKRVVGAAGALQGISHGNLGGDRTSNFVGVIRGAELLARLATGADVKDERVQFLAGELMQHMKNAWGDLGISQEGGNYIEYPGGFLMPCVLAMKELGDSTLWDEAVKHAHWKLMLYTRSFQPAYNHSLQWGVGHGSNNCEGWASFHLATCPKEQLPYYVFFYDRHMGRLAVGEPQHRFDSDRHGTVWALLLYPADVAGKDPTGVLPPAVADSRGYIFFRNRWKDADDVLGGIYAQNHKDGKGWSAPEQLVVNLMGFGSRFVGGPQKGREAGLFSSLLIDGKYSWEGATERMGKVLAFDAGKTGAYAIVQGGQMYEKMGAKEAVRHLLVEFLPDGRAIIATLDRVKGDGEHTYTWQANVGRGDDPSDWMKKWAPQAEPVNASDNIKVTSAVESKRPFFLMQGRRNGFAKGWVLTPADAQIKAGDPTQISTKATDADILVVMLLGQGDAPAAVVQGDGLGATLTVAGKTISFDAAVGRIVCK